MKRYYIDTIIGNGTEDDPYRPSLADKVNRTTEGYSAVMPPTPGGTPTVPYCLVVLESPNHGRFAALGADALPDVSLDVEWASVDRAARDAAGAAVRKRGGNAPQADPGEGYRFWLRRLGRTIEANFHENALDVRVG